MSKYFVIGRRWCKVDFLSYSVSGRGDHACHSRDGQTEEDKQKEVEAAENFPILRFSHGGGGDDVVCLLLLLQGPPLLHSGSIVQGRLGGLVSLKFNRKNGSLDA